MYHIAGQIKLVKLLQFILDEYLLSSLADSINSTELSFTDGNEAWETLKLLYTGRTTDFVPRQFLKYVSVRQ